MLKKAKIELFWFLKRDAMLDLDNPGTRQMYVQQVLTRGREGDIRELFKDIGFQGIHDVFQQIKQFVPTEVRMFWEDFFADYNTATKHST